MIIKVEAIIREEKCEAVMQALEDLQVNGLTVSRVEGYGAQRGSDNLTKGMKLVERVKRNSEGSIYRRLRRRKNFHL